MVTLKEELLTTATKGGGPPPRTTTLAAIESLAIPLVQEVVFLADFRCAKCQQRVAQIMSKMNGAYVSTVSLSSFEPLPYRPYKAMPSYNSGMRVIIGETQSVVISVLEKKVTLTCTYPNPDKLPVNRSSLSKVSLIGRLFRAQLTANYKRFTQEK
ncbi:hypothetical protein BUALT_Bualt17G0096400 [Buddleja alternifolia]|uniref:HMA domain-containing protein n=1 Tax=Buddleja alternifolia TaxID=168488 RepID=A0AAV6WDY9_9LAMI|nr:hypothetical protein BUALT_Bualt17G0096400 [Buddleja alternifolia]